MYGKMIGCDIYDDQATKTQRYPIIFEGAFTWDNIEFAQNRLLADAANSGTSIKLNTAAVLGSNINIYRNTDYSGTNPAQNSLTFVRGWHRFNHEK